MKMPATKEDKQTMEPLGTRCCLSQMQIALNQLGPVLPLKIFAANQMKRRKDAVPDTAEEEAACLAERRGMLSKRSYPGLKRRAWIRLAITCFWTFSLVKIPTPPST